MLCEFILRKQTTESCKPLMPACMRRDTLPQSITEDDIEWLHNQTQNSQQQDQTFNYHTTHYLTESPLSHTCTDQPHQHAITSTITSSEILNKQLINPTSPLLFVNLGGYHHISRTPHITNTNTTEREQTTHNTHTLQQSLSSHPPTLTTSEPLSYGHPAERRSEAGLMTAFERQFSEEEIGIMKMETADKERWCEGEGRLHQGTKKALHEQMMKETGVKMAYSTFCRKAKEIKKAKKGVDMCGACVRLEELQRKKKRDREEEEELQTLCEHQQQAAMMRTAYNAEVTSLSASQMVIVLDFKQDWELPIRHQQPGHDYYEKQAVAHLGIVAMVGGGERERERKYSFHYLSEILTKDIRYVGDCLKRSVSEVEMREEETGRKMNGEEWNKISVWVDTGTHFRNGCFMDCLFGNHETSVRQKCRTLSLSFFAEGHGKCVCDGEFGVLTGITHRHAHNITSINELVDFFRTHNTTNKCTDRNYELIRIYHKYVFSHS